MNKKFKLEDVGQSVSYTENSDEEQSEIQFSKKLIKKSILSKIRLVFEENCLECKKLNEEKQKQLQQQHINPSQEGFLKKVQNIKIKINAILSQIDTIHIDNKQRQQYIKILESINQELTKIDRKKGVSLKHNQSLEREIICTVDYLTLLKRDFEQLENSKFCSSNNIKRQIQNRFTNIQQGVLLFWTLINELEPLHDGPEAYPIYLSPTFKANEFETFVQTIVESYFPKDQKPITIIKEVEVPKYIEKIKEIHVGTKEVMVPDRIREAHELMFGICKPQNTFEALKIYQDEADNKGNISACNTLGKLYQEGKILPKDSLKAYQYYQKSEKQNDSEGIYQIGRLLEQGQLSKKDKLYGSREQEILSCIEYYERAAQQMHVDSITDLGYIYENGIKMDNDTKFIIKTDLEKAEYYYKLGQKLNYPRACNNLGSFYLNHQIKTDDNQDNYQKAIQCFEFASKNGYVKAELNLGICYEKGLGVQKDVQKAIIYFKEAGMKGDVDAKLHYVYYLLRDASNKNQEEDYFIIVNNLREILQIDPNKSDAYYYLGYLYESGFGVTQETKTALKYYKKAAKLQNIQSLNRLGDIFFSRTGDIKDQQDAIKYYQQAASLNSAIAYLNLGAIYEEGCMAINSNFQIAMQYYQKAAQLGCVSAYTNIGLLYQLGRGVEQDQNKANEFFQQAAEKGCPNAQMILNQSQYFNQSHNLAHQLVDVNAINLENLESCNNINNQDDEKKLFDFQSTTQERIVKLQSIQPLSMASKANSQYSTNEEVIQNYAVSDPLSDATNKVNNAQTTLINTDKLHKGSPIKRRLEKIYEQLQQCSQENGIYQ